MRTIVFLLLVDLVRGSAETDNIGKKAKDPVIFKLRSQLMKDNYDYQDEPEISGEKIFRAIPDGDSEEEQDNIFEKKDDSELSDFTVDRNVLNGYISDMPEATDDNESDEEGTDTEPEDKATETPGDETTPKDEWIEVIKSQSAASPYLFGADTTTELPYKVLTAHGISGRRSGSFGAVHRYLRAELNDTVVVAPFSPGPVPLFMLPKNRRQYREDSDGDNITGEDDTREPS